MADLSKLHIVGILPRYGQSLGGGAETLLRSLLLDLNRGLFSPWGCAVNVEVWTTCARDHRTWENYHPPGRSEEDGLTIHRFPVDARDTGKFIKHELMIQDGWPLSIDDQLDWLSEGVNSRGLYSHIVNHGPGVDAMIFAPYLFPTSFWGPLIYPHKSLLIPCLHDEKYAYLHVFKHVFHEVCGLLFNAEQEKQLASELYALPAMEEKSAVVGMTLEAPSLEEANLQATFERIVANVENPLAPYLLYSGRKEKGKNLDWLLDSFEKLPDKDPWNKLQLVLIGSGDIHFRESLPRRCLDLGFVTEEEKVALLANALALVQPSTNESFSIVLMESWQQQTPVLVNKSCRVTKDHVLRSGGGLYFSDACEFQAVVEELLRNKDLCIAMGKAGKRYVETEYSREAVGKRLRDILVKVVPRAGLLLANNGELVYAQVEPRDVESAEGQQY